MEDLAGPFRSVPIIKPRFRVRALPQGTFVSSPPPSASSRLVELGNFPANPGNLKALSYVPRGLQGPAPLVVVLHGCTQSAALYDQGSGWSSLADRHGFILLYAEQQRANNPMLCFNWFEAADTKRGSGEAASIRSMIDEMGRRHDLDPSRIFVTGLSAGGAMASVMLAAYPDVFSAGAIIAGVAYGCARDVGGAFECMNGRNQGSGAELGRKVKRASAYGGPWPRVQVWQGSADRTVVPANADAIIRQWVDVHGLPAAPDRTDRVEGQSRRTWQDSSGRSLIEHIEVAGMGHGVPLATGAENVGMVGAHMLDAGVSSTAHIAAFFGIAPAVKARANGRPDLPAARSAAPGRSGPADGIQPIIEDALRAAGLMR